MKYMHKRQKIWRPVHFDPRWLEVKTARFDNIRPSWDRKRLELSRNPEQYKQFIDRLKRKQAVDTGIIENLYDLKRGVTETLIKNGFAGSYLQHGDSNIEPRLLMNYLKDNFEALDYVFDLIKSGHELSVFDIRSLHQLITRHQDTVEAVDGLGRTGKIPLHKGGFKRLPNNPLRNGIVYEYCPPEQVDSEMDALVHLFHTEAAKAHVLIKAAFIHHAFVQIHPFQDGNGRMARLLASLVLIKDNLFPFSLDRDERAAYIDALEAADSGNCRQLVDILADNQIKSIEQALNLETAEKTGYDHVLNILNEKIASKTKEAAMEQQERIAKNMDAVFRIIKKQGEYYKGNLKLRLGTVRISAASSDDSNEHDYSFQIAQYAKEHTYYFNTSLPRRWTRLRMNFDPLHRYQLVLSLHHYGYDNSTFALGAFIEKEVIKKPEDLDPQARRDEIYTALGIPPLIFSSEKETAAVEESILQQIEALITSALGYIAEDLT
jgi:Fic family protein